MDFFDRRRLCDDKIFVASVIMLAAEIVRGQILHLDIRTHRSVEDDDLFMQKLCEGFHA